MKQIFQKNLFILAIFFLVYLSFLFLLSYTKWHYFLYDMKDLAIFSQTLSSLTQSFSLYNAIQQTSYFADHFSPFLFLFIFIFSLFSHPLLLTFLQIFILTGSSFLLFFIIKERTITLFFILLYLFQPITLNASLFEFHLLFLFPLFFFLTYIFFEKKHFPLFICTFILCLFIREDIALLLWAFSLFALLQKRSWKWILFPLFFSLIYVTLSLFLIQSFAQESYKFILLYHHLGNSFIEILHTLIFHPFSSLFLLFRLESLLTLLVLGMPLLFFPFFSPVFYLFAIIPFLQQGLSSVPAANLLIQTHYGLIFLPILLITTYQVFHKCKQKRFLALLLLVATLYTSWFFTPIIPLTSLIISAPPEMTHARQIQSSFILRSQAYTHVLASDEFLPHLSEKKTYALNYAYLGVKQFSHDAYIIPQLDGAILNTNDFMSFDMQYKNHVFYASYAQDGLKRLYQTLMQHELVPIALLDSYIFFTKDSTQSLPLLEVSMTKEEIPVVFHYTKPYIYLFLSLETTMIPDHYPFLQITIHPLNKTFIRPFGHGLYDEAVLHDYPYVQTHYSFYIPDIDENLLSDLSLEMRFVELRGGVELSPYLSSQPVIDDIIPITPVIRLHGSGI